MKEGNGREETRRGSVERLTEFGRRISGFSSSANADEEKVSHETQRVSKEAL
jgi:hypothetical protein